MTSVPIRRMVCNACSGLARHSGTAHGLYLGAAWTRDSGCTPQPTDDEGLCHRLPVEAPVSPLKQGLGFTTGDVGSGSQMQITPQDHVCHLGAASTFLERRAIELQFFLNKPWCPA